MWLLLLVTCAARQLENLDQDWRFLRVDAPLEPCSFSRRLPGRCRGLQPQGRPEDGGPGSATACRQSCCQDPLCNAWQWCGDECEAPQSCWKGLIDVSAACESNGTWEGYGDASRPRPEPLPGSKCEMEQCEQGFDDSSWRRLDVPHDFVVEGNFTRSADKSHGYLPYGLAWYRRRLCLPEAMDIQAGRKVSWLEFEGVMVRWKAWLNGIYLGGHFSGYTPKLLDIQLAPLEVGCENVLALQVDARAPDGWWYDGGGIYRRVWRHTAPPVHLAPWGLYAPAQVHSVGVSARATVMPFVEVRNQQNVARAVRLRCTVGHSSVELQGLVPPNASRNFQMPNISLNARLWSPESPELYVLEAELSSGSMTDQLSTSFGVRQLHWSSDTGFSINGVATKILGTANHQDFAALGVAVPDELQAYRLRKLQQLGANAWRTAHNPPAEALLTAADRQGVLVWDENHRNGQDEEMEVMIKRDRNHPSIVVWSICNERLCETADVWGDAKRLKALAERLDPFMGRVVSANYNEFNGKNTPMDLMGFDYGVEMYDRWHREAPSIPAMSSETSSAYSDRGVVSNDRALGHVRDYDTEHPSWGETSQVAWQAILSRPWVAGGFTWTGWDYRGEPTPYAWPDKSSHFGILDQAGFWKHRAYWYQACWTSEPVIHLLPHWNWCQSCANTTIEVWAYANVDLELFHPNGSSLGRRSNLRCSHAAWRVPYAPGRLVARSAHHKAELRTTGPPWALRLTLEAQLETMALVAVEVVDRQGHVVPTAATAVTLSAHGAQLLGSANGDPAQSAGAFNGRLMAVLRGQGELHAEAPGLQPASITWGTLIV